MMMTRINGCYNLIAKDENEKEFVQNLSQIVAMLGEDLDSREDTLFITGVTENVTERRFF